MNHHRDTLAQRRAALQARSAVLRERLGTHGQALRPALRVADTALTAGRWLRNHPQVVIGGLVAVALLKPGKAWRWGTSAWGLWRTVRPLVAAWAARRRPPGGPR